MAAALDAVPARSCCAASVSPRCALAGRPPRALPPLRRTAGRARGAPQSPALQPARTPPPARQRAGRGSGAAAAVASEGGVQFPPYTRVLQGGAYDLRLYDSFPVVKTAYEKRDEGYLLLGGYFDGQNEGGVRYAESQPVVMTYYPEGRKTMQLHMGKTRGGDPQPEKPPMPLDKNVKLEVAGGELVAVLKFEGYITPETAARARQQLVDALAADGLALADAEAAGLMRIAQYGAIFQFQSRVNEMMLAVKV